MIGNTLKGTRFKVTIAYLLSKNKVEHEDAHIIGGTVSTGSIAHIVDQFEGVRLLAPRRKHVVYHQMLRPPPHEGEALSDETWIEIATDHARAMGYGRGQWIAVRHRDHVHIVANRVLLTGKVVSDSHDWPRAERSVRAIEKKFGLIQVQSSHLLEPERAKEHERAPTQAEMALAEKGEVSVRSLIQDQLLAVIGPGQTLTQFADQLYERGVIVRPNIQSTGRLAGLSYVLKARPDLAFSGTSLGRRFTLGNLRKGGLCSDPQHDQDGIERCLQRCKATDGQQAAPQENREEPLRPLVDPKAALEHLKALKGPVILAALDRTGQVKELGVVDSRNLGSWRRRLRRRCARGEEILVRPTQESSVLVIPRCGRPEMVKLQKVGIEPFLVIESAWNRQDVWLRVTGGAPDAQKLRAGLHGIGLPTASGNEPVWGSLAGYRPDPESNENPTAARRITNTIADIRETAIEVSLELLERLRRLAEILKGQVARGKATGRSQQPRDEKGRSR